MTDKGLVAQTLAARQITDETFVYASEKALYDVLFNKFAIKYDRILPEVTRRETFLSQLGDKGISSRVDVKQAIYDYYRSRIT
jgi:hypothetical protein